MEIKEKEKKIRKIQRIMDLCCKESLSADVYTIETCKAEYDTDHILLFVYNCKHEIIEARLSNYDNMIEIAEKIRKKSKIHILQCCKIRKFVQKNIQMTCTIEVVNYRNDVLNVELYDGNKKEKIQGTYVEIIDKLKKI